MCDGHKIDDFDTNINTINLIYSGFWSFSKYIWKTIWMIRAWLEE
ncbi:hypothetical protein RCH33_2833 [Flavobacterium daejeonense]|nr:hypothetical protein RCH33_2833 [Flavobacterium daejeonense]